MARSRTSSGRGSRTGIETALKRPYRILLATDLRLEVTKRGAHVLGAVAIGDELNQTVDAGLGSSKARVRFSSFCG
jgi:hypothetical protein